MAPPARSRCGRSPRVWRASQPEHLLDAVAGWAKASRRTAELADALAALAESSPFDGDADDIVDAALGGRLGAAAVAVDEAMLRRLFAGADAGRR